MGQQQLLLLVLSTVIVGLATVAGIQAFSENQVQAEQDAINQRALGVASDIYSAIQKPTQLGGVSVSNNSVSTIASTAGYSDTDGGTSGVQVAADGAGDNAQCEITKNSGTVTVTCDSDGFGSNSGTNRTVAAEVSKNTEPTIVSVNGNTITQ